MFLKNKIRKETIDLIPEFDDNKNFISLDKPLQKVVRDVLVILSTRKTSVVYHPDSGSILYDSLWDNITEGLKQRIKVDIESNIAKSTNFVMKELEILNTDDNKSLEVKLVLNINERTDLSVIVDINQKGYITLQEATEIITETIIIPE